MYQHWTAAHHHLWWHIIRLIMAAHFHTTPHHIDEIDYWGGPPGTADATTVWSYPEDDDCDLHTWGRYDVCISRN